MTVKGVSQLKRNIGEFFFTVEKDTEATLKAIMMTARGHVMLNTPVDTSTLINSIDFNVSERSAVLYFRGGFADKAGFNYALFLEENVYADGSPVDWKPTKKPAAGPHFLRDGFESPEAKADIMTVIRASYRL